MRDLSHVFSFRIQNVPELRKGYEFLSFVLIMWL